MFEFIFGFKTVAMFDVWTVEHIMSGLSIGNIIKKNTRKHITKIHDKADHSHKSIIRFDLIGVLFLGYLWETIEHYLESGIAGDAVAFWFQGIEAWTNRIIADPLMLLLGYYIALKYPILVIPARIFSVLWLFVHIFIFPHSMYLHTLLF